MYVCMYVHISTMLEVLLGRGCCKNGISKLLGLSTWVLSLLVPAWEDVSIPVVRRCKTRVAILMVRPMFTPPSKAGPQGGQVK